MKPEIAGFLINSALFLAGLIFAGIMSGDHIATAMALGAVGFCTICYFAQLSGTHVIAGAFMMLSWVSGVASAAMLLLRYFH